MSVEILSVSLSDESIDRLAAAVAARLGGNTSVTTGNGAPQNAQQGPPQDDPWAGTNATQAPQNNQGQQGQGYQRNAQQQQNQGQQGPTCNHGPMRFIPSGFSKSNGRAYPAFWGCTAPRGAPDKCNSVPAAQ